MSHAVLGGGISGMAAAFYLSKSAAKNIRIYESSNRWGGWIKSVKSNTGALFELGPRMLRRGAESSHNALQMIEELQLMPMTKPLPSSNKEVDIKMLYLNNKLIRVPSGFSSLFKGHQPFIKPFIFAIMKDLRTPKKDVQDESIHDFVARRFGEEYAEILIGSLVCGIFAGDAKEISVKAIWKTIFDMEQQHGSVTRGFFNSWQRKKKAFKEGSPKNLNWSVWSFKDGLETLPTELSKHLQYMDNVDLFLENKCSRIRFQNGEAILTINGDEKKVSHVYSSLPSKELGKILDSEHSFLKTQLSSIPFVSVGVVNLEYPENTLKERGFGCLIPPNQNLPVLGITFDTRIFPQEGKTVLTVMMGGKWFELHFGANPDKELLLQTALDYVRKILNIEQKPVNSLVTIAKDCLPQYVVGHSKKVEEIRKYIAGRKLPLTLIGASFDGVSVTDAILSARKGVESALKQ